VSITGVVTSLSGHLGREGATPDAPTLRENALAVRSLTPAIAARAQAYLFAAAGILGALGVALPHPTQFDELGMLSVQGGSVVSAGVLLAFRNRVPAWLTTAGPFGAAALTSLVLVFSGSSASAYLLFYLWVALYAFYFLTSVEAISLAAFTILSYAAVVIGFRLAGTSMHGAEANEDIPAFVLTAGTLAVAGTFIVLLRERVGLLIRQLTDAASTDPLTGLLNRRGFHSALEVELARSDRGGRPVSLVLGDCDFFKQLNDTLGHTAGDEALLAIGRMLEGERRRTDVAARIGGEEFALVLPETDQHEAFMVAERVRTRMVALFAGRPVPLTMSFGVATYPQHAAAEDELLRAADDALYAAKALGRDRSVIHSAEIEGILAAGRDGADARHQAQLATVLNLAEALDMRDTGTARHSQTVGRLCEEMARRLGLERDRVDRIRIAGVLHDIGKIGVADSILRKPGPLTDEEFEAMRKHPEIGARILGGSGLEDIRQWILAHHERPDGRGYPYGLTGEEIPLEARILAVGDSYEAMTSDRVYRRSIGSEAACAELRRCAGGQFDSGVVAAFLEVLEERAGGASSTGSSAAPAPR
jgi:diguanylate cyclase (GGDEF)-like protein/putative nucleotidyltransferase with HDIG domain